MKLTPAQEKFCLAVAAGESQSDAYRKAFPNSLKWKDTSVHVKASNMASIDTVMVRIAELRDKAVVRCQITLESHINKLQELRDIALREGQLAAAIKAEELTGKVSGFYIEKRENVNRDEFTDKAALQKRIQDRQAKLGLTPASNVTPIRKDVA